MADELRINGNIHSWGSITAKVDGQKFFGFTLVSYGDKRERVHVWGMGKHHAPRARTSGKYTPNEGKLGGPISTIQALREALAAKSKDGKSYGSVEFELVVQYIEANDKPILDEIHRCVLVSNDSSREESPDPLKDEVAFLPMSIVRNGLTLYEGSEGTP